HGEVVADGAGHLEDDGGAEAAEPAEASGPIATADDHGSGAVPMRRADDHGSGAVPMPRADDHGSGAVAMRRADDHGSGAVPAADAAVADRGQGGPDDTGARARVAREVARTVPLPGTGPTIGTGPILTFKGPEVPPFPEVPDAGLLNA